MIDSILYCRREKSCLVFDVSCNNCLLERDLNIDSDGFFMDNLSFHVVVNSILYLCSFSFSNKYFKEKEDSLRLNCEILNKELGLSLSVESGRTFVRKSWIEKFGSGTMLSKLNIKNNHIAKGSTVCFANTEVDILRDCDLTEHMCALSELFRGKYRVKLLCSLPKKHALVFRIKDRTVLDPSLFALEKI